MNSSNPFVTNPTSMGMGERIAYGIIFSIMMRLSQRGYIDPSMAEYITLGIVSGGGSLLAWWLNRPQLTAQTLANLSREQLAKPEIAKPVLSAAGAVPNPAAPDGRTVVVTSPALARATPDAPTVVSSNEHSVVSKAP